MAHLYELSSQYSVLTEFLAQDNGEVIFNEEQFKEQLAQITEQLNVKSENIAKLILSMQSDSEGISKEVDRLSNRKRILENKTTWLKDYLKIEMQNAKVEKIEGSILTLTLQKSPPSCEILDESLVPQIFKKHIPESWQISKTEILSHFRNTGEIVEGSKIITDKKTLRIR